MWDYIRGENIFPDYPRIDDVELAWDMAHAEKPYLELGRAALSIGNYQVIYENRQLADQASKAIFTDWLEQPDNPYVEQFRIKMYHKYDELTASGGGIALFDSRLASGEATFLEDWETERWEALRLE